MGNVNVYDYYKQTFTYKDEDYDLNTGEFEMDKLALEAVRFKLGDITLQDLYLELLLHDKELMMK